MGKQILHIASGIPPDSSGTGRLLSHLISQAPSEPDWDIRFHYPRRPVGSRRAMIKQRRVVEAALDWLRVGLSWNVLRLKLAWLSLFGRGRILFFHPQTLGFRRTLRYLRAWRGRAFLFGLDNSFFCVRSYNHVRGEAAPCLRCLGGRFEAAEEMACSPFPVPDDAAFAYVRALRELLSDGAVNVLAQNEANAELYRRHTDGRAQVQVVGLWTADWTPLFTSSAPQPAEGGFDVVFHSHFVPAKGAEWMLEVARHLPQARILYPTPLPRGAGPAPDNVVFKRMTWETGLAEEASKAKIVCVPSVWSATIEGALIKSIITGKAAARVRAEGAYGEELPDGLVLDLDPNPAAAARTLADALAKGWQPEEGLRTAWIASFQRENFALLKHLLRAIKPSAAREDTPAAVAGIAPPEPAAAAEDPPLPEPAPAANGRDIRLEKLGTTYGGWKVPVEHIDERWTCYCVGAGEDISFDCALIERFGCDVYVFDPTPRSVDHVAELSRRVAAGQEMPVNNNPEVLYTLPPDKLHRLHFRPYGVWSQNTTQRFYKPKNSAHVSHSILNLQKTEDYIEAECRTLASLMQELGHSRIDLLKIDVEGAEYEVLKSMLADGIAPRVLCVEFDEGNQPLDDGAPERIARTIADLQAAGFDLVEQEGWNAIFVRHDELPRPAVDRLFGSRTPAMETASHTFSDSKSLLDRFDRLEGMMSRLAAASFIAVLKQQSARAQEGHVVEFGVYKGKSAFLLAHFVALGERLALVDINILPEVQQVKKVAPNCEIIQASSTAFAKSPRLSSTLQGQVRFLHVDGSHTFDNVAEDLEIAEQLVSPEALVVLDDFLNPNYPQVQAATYRHLYTKNSRFSLFLFGANKAFLVNKEKHQYWLNYALSDFPKDMSAIGHRVMLARTDSHSLLDAVFFRGRKPDEPEIYGAQLYRRLFPKAS